MANTRGGDALGLTGDGDDDSDADGSEDMETPRDRVTSTGTLGAAISVRDTRTKSAVLSEEAERGRPGLDDDVITTFVGVSAPLLVSHETTFVTVKLVDILEVLLAEANLLLAKSSNLVTLPATSMGTPLLLAEVEVGLGGSGGLRLGMETAASITGRL